MEDLDSHLTLKTILTSDKAIYVQIKISTTLFKAAFQHRSLNLFKYLLEAVTKLTLMCCMEEQRNAKLNRKLSMWSHI